MSAVNAVTVIFGSENEDLAKTMVKLQAAMALVQGLQGLRGLGAGLERAMKAFRAMTISMGAASTATKGFAASLAVVKAAIIQTGIGALVVALGVLISKLSELKKEASATVQAADAAEVIESSLNRMMKQSNTELEKSEVERERALTQGTEDEIKIWEKYVEDLKQELDLANTVVEQHNERYISQIASIFQSNRKMRKEFKNSPFEDWFSFAEH